jgi:hypothetical protein
MSRTFRRFEILLPLRYNDGRPIRSELIADTLLELEQRFGAISSETQTIQGRWRHEGKSYRDDLFRIFLDAPDVPETLAFLRQFKETLKNRFEQIDIWMTTYPIEVL